MGLRRRCHDDWGEGGERGGGRLFICPSPDLANRSAVIGF